MTYAIGRYRELIFQLNYRESQRLYNDALLGHWGGFKLKIALIKFFLVSCFIIAMVFQNNIGLADNGDFSRSIGWVSTGPVGFERNWPLVGTDEYEKRFFNYWIPYWKLNWNIPSQFKTSVVVLWFPGVVANSLLYAENILYLPIVSLFPKIILFELVLLLFKWIDGQQKYQILLMLCLGGPFILLCTSTDYLVYFNSFYQETGSFIFFLLLITSIIFLWHHPSAINFLSGIVIILLLATAKRGNFYWLFLGIPTILYVLNSRKIIKIKTLLLQAFLLILLVTSTSVFLTRANQNLPYNSMFYGVLTFSNDPQTHLNQLGMVDAMRCVNFSIFTPIGLECSKKYNEHLSYLNSARIVIAEPSIMFRMMKHVLDRMQDVSLDYLGLYTFDDPRSLASPRDQSGSNERFWKTANRTTPLNLWATIKYSLFPTGNVLGAVIILFLVWFMLNIRQAKRYHVLFVVGLLSISACIIDMFVAIFGDGRQELIKHLFMSNVYFDVAFIIFLSTALLFCFEFVEKYCRPGKISRKNIEMDVSQVLSREIAGSAGICGFAENEA